MLPVAQILLEALRYPWTDGERAAASSPPYPQPAALAPHRQRVLAELDALLPADGDGPVVATRALSETNSLRTELERMHRAPFKFEDAACVLLIAGAISIGEAEQIIPELTPVFAAGLRRAIVLRLLAEGDVQGATRAAAECGDRAYCAHRDIGAYFARRGEHEEFLSRMKSFGPGKDKVQLSSLKRDLVSGIAEREGWRAGVAVADDKRLTGEFRGSAFFPIARSGDVEGLMAIFTDNPDLLPELSQLGLLTTAMRAATPVPPTADHPLLAEIVDRIIAIDPKADKSTMQSRDGMLSSLWTSIGEQQTLDRVRAAIRTPLLKRGLKQLYRVSASK